MVSGALVAVLAIGVVVTQSGVLTVSPKEGGPLVAQPAHGSALPIKVGEKFTDAFDYLEVEGDDAIIIESITPEFDTDAVKVLGMMLSDPGRSTLVPEQIYYQWPPKDEHLGTTVTAAGATVQPDGKGQNAPQVLMGMEVTREGHFLRTGFWVNYRVGETHYRRFDPAQMTFCTPTAMEGTECPFLGGE